MSSSLLTDAYLQEFITNGYVVIPDVLTEDEIDQSRSRFHDQLMTYGINHDEILNNHIDQGLGVRKKSVVASQVFYADWKLAITLNPKVYHTIRDLMLQTFGDGQNHLFQHQNGKFDDVVPYVDRVCYRLPDHIRTEGGLKLHIDRIPDRDHGGKRWRPIQSFVSLTDHYTSESGGLKVVRGFHHQFNQYFKGLGSNLKDKDAEVNLDDNNQEMKGEFYRMHHHNLPTELVIVPKGSLVLWDNRLPHLTCDQLNLNDTREVVYLSYLPNIALNREYHRLQYQHVLKGLPPPMYYHKTNIKDNYQTDLDKSIEHYPLLKP